MNGDAALTAFIARVRKLGTLPDDAAKLAAPLLEQEAKRTAAAGTTPDGHAWAPKKDGGRALVNAADAITAEAIGPTVVLRLRGVEVVHHKGTKRLPKREILPDGGTGLPKNMALALERASELAFKRAMGEG